MKERPLLSFLGGFAIAGVAIGILVLVSWVLIEPISAPEKEGTIKFSADHFDLWYQEEGKGVSEHEALIDKLQTDLKELTELLGVELALIPDPIDVFVHDDVPAMQYSISKRKSVTSRGGYAAPLNLLVGESPRRRLAELVLAFGWGECGSTLLRHGMSLYASDPGRNFHAVIAALPLRLFHPLTELILMENRRDFPDSIYEEFDSPYSPAFIQFADLRSLIGLSVQQTISPEEILELEAASFVQFLIEARGGVETVKRIWGRGSTENLLKRIEWVSLEEMGDLWYSHAKKKGKSSPDFEFLSVYYLMGAGFPDSAWRRCSSWDRDKLNQDELGIAALSAVGVGKFGQAETFSSELDNDHDRARIEAYISLFDGWEVFEEGKLRFFVSADIAETDYPQASKLGNALDMVVERLALEPGELPERVTLFFYPDVEQRKLGKGLFPLLPQDNATIHLTVGDDAQYEMVSIIPVYSWQKDTYSRILRVGLSVALCRTEEELIEQGTAIRQEGRWYALGSVDFGMAPDEVVEVEAGLMMSHILDTCGGKALRKIWIATSPLDQYVSLDTAIAEVCLTTRQEIEKALFASFAT